METIRTDLTKGTIPSGCRGCFESEKTVGHSMRSTENKRFSKFITTSQDGHRTFTLGDPQFRYLDVRWSNLCNMKCRDCGEFLSSSWAAELGQPKPVTRPELNLQELYENILPNIEVIHFAGGEPTIMGEVYEILVRLAELKKTNVEILFTTNGMKLNKGSQHILELLEPFTNVSFSVSLDGYGKKAEYMRSGTDWKVLLENIQLAKEFSKKQRMAGKKFYLGAYYTLYALNVLHTVDFLQYFNANLGIPILFNPLYNPDYFHTDALPPQIRKDAVKLYQTSPFPLYSLIDHITFSEFHWDQQKFKDFCRHVKHVDQVRGENLFSTFPELLNYPELVSGYESA